MRVLATIPLLHHPGDAWLYNTGSDILGVLIARVVGQPFAEFLAERIFGPLAMRDTGFHVPAAKLDRFTTATGPTRAGLVVTDRRTASGARPPAFCSGAGGLVSTVDDLLAFQRMLLGGRRGRAVAGVGRADDHRPPDRRAARREHLFLEGQGWGFGGSVDVDGSRRGTCRAATAGSAAPARRHTSRRHRSAVSILLTQVEMTGPTPTPLMREFWRYAAGA